MVFDVSDRRVMQARALALICVFPYLQCTAGFLVPLSMTRAPNTCPLEPQ